MSDVPSSGAPASDPPSSEVIPVFPLTGSLLLPGNFLPLNIFETRYRNMVEDALGGPRLIGMIQPVVPRNDNRPDLTADPGHPDLYEVGCVGVIEESEPQDDGRYLILLKGLTRFRIEEELPLQRGYRQVRASYEEFREDLDEPRQELDPSRLLAALEAFAERQQLSFDMERLRLMPGVTLLNGLAVALPFPPGEKQALLEADSVEQREELLLSLMGMGLEGVTESQYYSPPPVN
jgi:Lon protease-like protein